MGILHNVYPNDYAGCINLLSKSKGKYYIATIIIGILAQLLCEFIGLNKWYCKFGNTCLK